MLKSAIDFSELNFLVRHDITLHLIVVFILILKTSSITLLDILLLIIVSKAVKNSSESCCPYPTKMLLLEETSFLINLGTKTLPLWL